MEEEHLKNTAFVRFVLFHPFQFSVGTWGFVFWTLQLHLLRPPQLFGTDNTAEPRTG